MLDIGSKRLFLSYLQIFIGMIIGKIVAQLEVWRARDTTLDTFIGKSFEHLECVSQ
jgi:hypothetical protein